MKKYKEFIKTSVYTSIVNRQKINEEFIENSYISIGEFLEQIRIPDNGISEWWNDNSGKVVDKIYYFPFNTHEPIAGGIIGPREIAINAKLPMPPEMKLLLLIHESAHLLQHEKQIFMGRYFDSVVNGNREEFLEAYKELEQDANDYALKAVRELGFNRFEGPFEVMVRGNEQAGPMVYDMMRADIEKYNPKNIFELIRKQI